MAQQQYTPQMNQAARQLIRARGITMRQQIFSTSIATPGTNTILNIPPRNVGLIKRFFIEASTTISNASGTQTLAPTNFGIANLLSNITFTDLNNNQRINTPGWHIHSLQSYRTKFPYGAAIKTSADDSPVNMGANWTIANNTTSIATSGTGTGQIVYEVPIAYSDEDLRGAIYAGVVNATMNLALTINPAPIVAATVDPVSAMYQGTSATGSLGTTKITVWQEYVDQLPMGPQGPVLPLLDLSTIYEMKQTTMQGLVAAQDFPIPYANFRDFLSTCVIFDNNGTFNTGSDVSYWALQSANFTNIFKEDAVLAALDVRKVMGTDMTPGQYWFDSRKKPISTTQYGNMQLILNPSTVNSASGSIVLVGFEDFALINAVTGAGSLPAS